mgnify:CR=1 FL=1
MPGCGTKSLHALANSFGNFANLGDRGVVVKHSRKLTFGVSHKPPFYPLCRGREQFPEQPFFAEDLTGGRPIPKEVEGKRRGRRFTTSYQPIK